MRTKRWMLWVLLFISIIPVVLMLLPQPPPSTIPAMTIADLPPGKEVIWHETDEIEFSFPNHQVRLVVREISTASVSIDGAEITLLKAWGPILIKVGNAYLEMGRVLEINPKSIKVWVYDEADQLKPIDLGR